VPRAMLLFERQADASWLPTTVILATPKRLQGKALPGSADRDARLAMLLTDALPRSVCFIPSSVRGRWLDPAFRNVLPPVWDGSG